MAYTPHEWVNYHVPAINDTHLNEVEAGIVGAYDLLTPDHVYYVSPGFDVDEATHRFDTINGANEYVLANKPPYPAKATIFVYPGKYEESIENSFYRIHIVGTAHTSYYLKGAILYNVGDIPDNYPLKCAGSSPLNLINMTVMVDSGGTYGELPNLRADNCSFRTGEFTEYTGSGGRSLEFLDCNLAGNMFDLTGVTDSRFLAFRRCDLGGPGTFALNFNSTGSSKLIKFERCICKNEVNVAGDWSISAYLSEMYDGGRYIFNTNGSLVFDKVLMPDGMHFTKDTSQQKSFVDCSFLNLDIAVDHLDVSADVNITDVNYSGNIQQNGICGCIQINNPEKHVGEHDDKYFNLQCAIDAVPDGADATIRVWEDLTDLAELTLTNPNTKITINGQKKYSLAFTGDIVEIGANRTFGLADMGTISGGNMHLNGSGSEISFESCQYITGYVTIDLGGFAILYKSSLFGSTGHKAIYINNVDTPVIIGYSRVQGSTGNPAVEINAAADTKFKAKFSTFIHGDKTNICPLSQTVGGSLNIAMYLCGVNELWNSPNPFVNVISKAGIVDDTEINF